MEELVEGFEGFVWNDIKDEYESDVGESYSRKFVEYCSAKAVKEFCEKVDEKIADGSFSRFTFDAMLAWEMPTSSQEEYSMVDIYIYI